MDRPPLRVGLLLDAWVVRAWVARIVDELRSAPWVDLELVVLNAAQARRPGPVERLWRQRRHLLYLAYTRLDRWLLRRQPDAFAVRDLEPALADRVVLHVSPERRKHSDYFPADAVEEIRSHDLDVVLRFGFRILRGPVLEIARYGIWSYHHGDDREQRGGPPGFWEVMKGRPVTGSVLQILTEKLDAGPVLYRSYAPTHRRSVERNKQHLYWKSASFMPRVLEALHDRGPEVLQPAPAAEPRPDSGRIFRKPTNGQFLRIFPPFARRATADKTAELFTHNQWFVAFSLDAGLDPLAARARSFQRILPPRDRSWADPFPVRHRGKHFVFVEEYLHRARRGRISVLEIDGEAGCAPPVAVLEKGYHLSYPFVFRWNGQYFMIPESAENRAVELYRCLDFPWEWQLEVRLLEGVRAVDATLYHDPPRWWMFVNVAVEGAAHPHDELHLYRADRPHGPWRPHRRNPVKSDARSARPAGSLMARNGVLYRPAQDCSRRYGWAIAWNRVRRLDDGGYEEITESRLLPDWASGLLATHTINQAAGLTVLDGMRRVPRLLGGRPKPGGAAWWLEPGF